MPTFCATRRYAVRQLMQDARLHRRRDPDAGARHRRHQRDLQRRQRRAAAAAAVSESGRAGAGARDRAALRPLLRRAGDVPRLAAAEHACSSASRRTNDGRRDAHRRERRRADLRARRCRGTCSSCCASPPALGRGFTPDEDTPGKNNVIVLSHGMWQRRFGGDPPRARPVGHAQRRAGDDRRRDAAGILLSMARRRILAAARAQSGQRHPRRPLPRRDRPAEAGRDAFSRPAPR